MGLFRYDANMWKKLHPRRLTWNTIMEVWFRSVSFLFKQVIWCRFQPFIFQGFRCGEHFWWSKSIVLAPQLMRFGNFKREIAACKATKRRDQFVIAIPHSLHLGAKEPEKSQIFDVTFFELKKEMAGWNLCIFFTTHTVWLKSCR